MRTLLLTLLLPLQFLGGARTRPTGARAISTLIIAAALASLLIAGESAQASEPEPLDLAGKSEVENLAAQASYIFFEAEPNESGITPNISFEEALSLTATQNEYTMREVTEGLAIENPNAMDGEYLFGPIWARLILINSSDGVARWRIDARDAYGPTLRAFAVGRDGPQLILDNRWATQAMDQRVPQERLVASHIIEVPAGGTSEVWIDAEYGIGFDDYLRLVSEERFDADRQSDLASASVIFGARVALLLALLAFALVLRDRTAFYYAGFHSGLLLTTLSQWGFDSFYLGFGEVESGIAFRLTWAVTFVFYALTLASFLNARSRYPRYARLLLFSTATGLLILPILSVIDLNIHRQWFRPFVEAIAISQFVLVVAAGILMGLRDRLPGARWFVFASAMLAVLASMQGLYAFGLLKLAAWEVDAFANALFAIDGLLFACALVMRAIDIREQRDEARDAEMAALTQKADLQDRLAEAELDYQLASEIAEKRRRDLEATSHDLKQPLLSLQIALSKMEGSEDAAEGVSYIERVLRRTQADTEAGAPEQKQQSGFELTRALHNVTTMFRDEAEVKGMALVNVKTSARVAAEPVRLMRILANLVSNAIQHSQGSRILMGAKRNGDALDLIVADNGLGISDGEVATAFERYRKGDASDGDGIGLSTVQGLAREQGWSVSVMGLKGGGALFRIEGVQWARL